MFIEGPSCNLSHRALFNELEYTTYRRVTEKLKAHVESVFGLKALYFTAPTFITRYLILVI